ncbi:hypothetical protein BS78_K193200 [Paspalum vaginatum]|uniref:CCHC-type domain-containing protein n=1 Tax=Paspalum vaginatum TaxID=158149 RepID=A0A9W7XAV4_9POAL|nr:hypothetical protein BS78_K193200 [Paspalum vaginatum]
MSKEPETLESSRGGDATSERVVSSNAIELLLLTKANYHEWALVIQVSLEAMKLWDAVEKVCNERARDRRVLAAILPAVLTVMKAGLAVKATTKEAWEAVRLMQVGDDRVKAASAQRLWKEFENFGSTTVLRVISRKFKQVDVAIEMLTDLNTATIEELIGRLRMAKDADKEDVQEVAEEAGRLYLTEEQWEAWHRQRNKERTHSGDGRRGGYGGDKRSSGDNNGGGNHDERSEIDDDSSSVASGSNHLRGHRNCGQCYECSEIGHIDRWCRERKKKETALLADADTLALL